jgi:restriction endonuclease S subunit
VELNSNDFRFDNFDFRLDSEYFKKSNLELLEKLDLIGYKKIGEFSYVTDGIHTSIDYSETSNINLISATSPRENFFDVSRKAFISELAHKNNPRTAIQEGDIILSTVGTIGNCAVATKSILPANSDRHVGIIRCNNDFLPNYVSTFLLSKFGRFQTWRESTGNVQLNLFIYKIRTLKIANLSNSFQGTIDNLIKEGHSKRQKSIEFYLSSETLLLETLGLNNFEPTAEAVNVKSFKESFLSSGRLDAEYYQKKYEDYIDLICSYPNGYEIIELSCNQKDINSTPKDNAEYKYIELANIGKTGDIKSCTIAFGSELPTRARRKVNTNDVIISSIEGSLDSCALVNEEYNNALCSTGFYIISSDKINSETLLVLFKSEPIQNILKKSCSGTILTAINKTEFQNIPIPIIDKSIQEKIASLVSESFTLKKQSEQLLETAKRAVEIAIEEGEEVALQYIQQYK